MSLHPQYAAAILAGEKTVEFRKRALAEDVRYVVMYATKPIAELVGVFRVASQEIAEPESAWARFGHKGSINREEFFRYFEGARAAVAISVDQVIAITPTVPLEAGTGIKHPPQSFQYLNEGPSVLADLQAQGPQ